MAVDSQWGNTSLLLPLSEGLFDVKGHTITAGGGIALSSAVGTPFGAGSALYCDGTNDVLTSVSSDFTLDTGDCTIQFWFYPVTGGHGAAWGRLLAIGADGVNGSIYINTRSSEDPMNFRFEYYNSGYSQFIADVTAPVSNGAWHFFQLDRVSNVWSCYVDGSLHSTQTTSFNFTQTTLALGANTAGATAFKGYFSDVRVTKGAYRSSHAVPSEPFPCPPDVLWANTSLLLPLSENLLDVKGHAMTATGGIALSSAVGTPFGAGNALYCDGSNDVLTSTSAGFTLGTGDCSIQFWFYPVTGGHGASYARLFAIGAFGVSGSLYIASSGMSDPMKFYFEYYNAGYSQLINEVATTITSNAWHFFQLDRVAGVWSSYIDGTLYSTQSTSINLSQTTLALGANTAGTLPFKGYFFDVRVTKGGYRSSHAVPSEPFPRPSISGVTRNGAGALASKVVKAFKRSTAALVGSDVSDAVTGEYAIYPDDYFLEHFVVEFDTATDPLVDGGSGENSLIYDRVIPG